MRYGLKSGNWKLEMVVKSGSILSARNNEVGVTIAVVLFRGSSVTQSIDSRRVVISYFGTSIVLA